MSDYTPVSSDMGSATWTAAVAITGGQLLDCTGVNTVSPSAGVVRPIGVAAHDAGVGQRVTVYLLPGLIHEVIIANTVVIAPGSPIKPFIGALAGTVDTGTLATVAAAGLHIGTCLVGGTGVAAAPFVKARFIGV